LNGVGQNALAMAAENPKDEFRRQADAGIRVKIHVLSIASAKRASITRRLPTALARLMRTRGAVVILRVHVVLGSNVAFLIAYDPRSNVENTPDCPKVLRPLAMRTAR
jgi:hypothetical protein